VTAQQAAHQMEIEIEASMQIERDARAVAGLSSDWSFGAIDCFTLQPTMQQITAHVTHRAVVCLPRLKSQCVRLRVRVRVRVHVRVRVRVTQVCARVYVCVCVCGVCSHATHTHIIPESAAQTELCYTYAGVVFVTQCNPPHHTRNTLHRRLRCVTDMQESCHTYA